VLWDEPTPADPTCDPTFSVAELADVLTMWTRRAFPDEVWVRGEIRNLSRPNSGHVYFTLVECDERQQVMASMPVMLSRVVRPEINAILVRAGGRVRMADGAEVRIRGRVTWFTPRGQLQLLMTGVDPDYTLGRLAAERERLLRALEAEGLLGRNGRLLMPPVPIVVGLVTSAGSAAEADFLDELRASGLGFRVLRGDTRVQGLDAPASIVATLRSVARRAPDVIALVRGGGARTDLVAFDDELVARAIAALDVPVITGIGHEVDRSIADEVAHTALKTPTACAQHLISAVRSFVDSLDGMWTAVASRAVRRLDREDDRVTRHTREVVVAARGCVRLATQRVDVRSGRVGGAARGQVRAAARHLDGCDARVRALDPAATLARGWSITRRADGGLVRSPADAPAGTALRTTIAGGEVRSTVDGKDAGDGGV
jgi:exodeoxyribonuclease VII large subunit